MKNPQMPRTVYANSSGYVTGNYSVVLSAYDPVGTIVEDSLTVFQEYITNVVMRFAPKSITMSPNQQCLAPYQELRS